MIIGIDLGTTNSSCAACDSGEPFMIPNDRGSRITPSIVSFSPSGEVLVGEAAKNQAVLNADRTVRAVKRLMGTDTTIPIGDSLYTPEQISSLILSKLKKDAETYLGGSVDEAVITVPAYFTETQRRATRRAGTLAGFNVRRIINEPTSAGLSCSAELPEICTVLVYDLGGGTFDVSVLRKSKDLLEVLATAGDNSFGGIDFDRVILQEAAARFSEQAGLDIRTDTAITQQLTDLVERAKIELSSREETQISIPFVRSGGKALHLSYSLGRQDFVSMIRPMIEKSRRLTLSAVEDAGMDPRSIDYIVFSGGSSRIPAVRASISELIPARAASRVHPEEVVASGAAVQAYMITRDSGSRVLKDITPLPLGVESQGDSFFPILGKNTPIPTRKKQIFTTLVDRQEAVEINVLQGLSERASKNNSLGRFRLFGIETAVEGVPRIEVEFCIDEDGILTVQAKDSRTGVFQDISITEPADSLQDGKTSSVRQRLEGLLARTEKLYRENKDYLDPVFSGEIYDILNSCRRAFRSGDYSRESEYRAALETIICEIESITREKELKDA